MEMGRRIAQRTQMLEATPIGKAGLELLRARARKVDAEAALNTKRAESLSLKEQQAEAQAASDAAKASHEIAKGEHGRLRARLEELQHGDDDEDDDEATTTVAQLGARAAAPEAAQAPPSGYSTRRNKRPRTD